MACEAMMIHSAVEALVGQIPRDDRGGKCTLAGTWHKSSPSVFPLSFIRPSSRSANTGIHAPQIANSRDIQGTDAEIVVAHCVLSKARGWHGAISSPKT